MTPKRQPGPGDGWDVVLIDMYQRHFVELTRQAKRFVDTDAEAEEVVQDAFVKFHTALHRPAAGKELPYLRSIVLNQARSLLRRRHIARLWKHDEPRHGPSGEDDFLRQHESDAVRRALATLPQRQREALMYRHLIGLSERETAAAMSISVGSVKTHSSRGRLTMRDQLGVA